MYAIRRLSGESRFVPTDRAAQLRVGGEIGTEIATGATRAKRGTAAYLAAAHHGLFVTYESFAMVSASMTVQHKAAPLRFIAT